MQHLEGEMYRLSRRVEQIDREHKKLEIRIFNAPANEKTPIGQFHQIVDSLFDEHTTREIIMNVKDIKRASSDDQALIVTLGTFLHKRLIMKNKMKLADLPNPFHPDKKISITQNLTTAQNREAQNRNAILGELKKQGINAYRVGYNLIKVDGQPPKHYSQFEDTAPGPSNRAEGPEPMNDEAD